VAKKEKENEERVREGKLRVSLGRTDYPRGGK